jgi:sulfur-oxidizing protein SoxZ
MARPLINIPKTAKRGDVVEVKTLFSHPMDTGYLRDNSGQVVPKHIIQRFVCTYAGNEVFSADLTQAIAANPFISFTLRATETGVIALAWTDDRGETQSELVKITVE